MSSITHKKLISSVQLILTGMALPISLMANENLFENNFDLVSNKVKLESTQYDSKLNKSLFLPEFSIITGVGSELEKDKAHGEKGLFLYLDGKINLYNGGRNQSQEQIIKLNNLKLYYKNESISRQVKAETFKIISEIKKHKLDTTLLEEEIKENEIQLSMAKKKVDAGLTTIADLLDFQIKTENIKNQIESNLFEIAESEKELNILLGKNFTSDQMQFLFIESNDQLNLPANLEKLPKILALKTEVKASNIEVKNTKAEYLPTVDIEAKYGSISPTSKLFDKKIEHQIALNISFPIFSNFSTSAKTSKAVLDLTLKNQELRQLEINLMKNIEQEKKKIELNEKILTVLKATFERVSKYKELIIVEYKKGIKNSSDVINASDKKLELSRKINELNLDTKSLIFSYNTNFQTKLEQE